MPDHRDPLARGRRWKRRGDGEEQGSLIVPRAIVGSEWDFVESVEECPNAWAKTIIDGL